MTTLAGELGIPTVYLLNDLAAIANALTILQPADLYALNVGKPMAGGSMAVIAPGTGLGEAFLVWDGGAIAPIPLKAAILTLPQPMIGRWASGTICAPGWALTM